MATQVIYPADTLSRWIADGFKRHPECLLTVAYFDAAGVEAIVDAVKARLDRKRSRVRILFQDHGFRTHPDAIARLLGARRARPGALQLRYAGKPLRAFHAKAYGFRKGPNAPPEVIVGSSNVTDKALGVDCGEMNVMLSGRAAEAAWSIMEEEYWANGTDVNRAWLNKYTRAHARYEQLAAAANLMLERWRGSASPRRAYRPWDGAISAEHTYPFSPEEAKSHRQRVAAARTNGIEVPRKFIAMESRSDALALSRAGEVLDVFWRARDANHRGIRSVGFIHPGGVQIIGNARLGKRWLVRYSDVPGTRVAFKLRDCERVERVLKKQGYSYTTLEQISGRLRGRRKVMREIYTGLRSLASAAKRRTAEVA